jgi:hypothetical protein
MRARERTAHNVITLLRAYDENPDAFGDDSGIAESGNGIPDILDEVKWALDWPAVLKVVAGTNFWDSQIVRKMIHHMDEAVAIPSVGFEGGLRLLSGSP